MPATPPSNPRDVADILEAIARRLRADPAFLGELSRRPAAGFQRVAVTQPTNLDITDDGVPDFGAVDVLVGDTHVTVTAETRNADQSSVHVSVMERHLILSVGEGSDERRRDLTLPVDVDEDLAAATFRNGVLDVVLPIRRRATGGEARSRA
jgi:HSP20 family molecular chaperone IbpA